MELFRAALTGEAGGVSVWFGSVEWEEAEEVGVAFFWRVTYWPFAMFEFSIFRCFHSILGGSGVVFRPRHHLLHRMDCSSKTECRSFDEPLSEVGILSI